MARPHSPKSGRRDSNSRHTAWEAVTLPTELRPQRSRFVNGGGSVFEKYHIWVGLQVFAGKNNRWGAGFNFKSTGLSTCQSLIIEQSPKLGFIQNRDSQRLGFLQLAACLIAGQKISRFAADTRSGFASMLLDQGMGLFA